MDPARLAATEIGPGTLAVPTDVTDEAQCVRLVEAAVERHGRIDGMVLPPGVARHVPLAEMALREGQDMPAVHLTGAFVCPREAAPAVTGGGSVVCLASSAAAGLGPLHQAHGRERLTVVAAQAERMPGGVEEHAYVLLRLDRR
ncbi:SDR family oxidoreductase [Nonomuraea terrae]|uniref:SDR family oxidoreductase n=1 Tax=Nonomuraea terrae TaxID=2530383 RepID=UPI0037AD336A